ncbi:MAG: hypothetical protein H0V81_11965 [Solirubrobacterales bacterium]|nr:hypothetical protein [Solirubrobacterales bacterium]
MTREEAEAAAVQRREAEPGATWTVVERDGAWRVVRIGLSPGRPSGTATKPPPEGPRDNPDTRTHDPNWGF